MSTSADRREEKNMNKMAITAYRATTAPNYEITAGGLLDAARAFCRDKWEPETEKAFQEWKKTRKGGKHE